MRVSLLNKSGLPTQAALSGSFKPLSDLIDLAFSLIVITIERFVSTASSVLVQYRRASYHCFLFSAHSSGFNKRIEYEPGTGSLALFPSMHLETCDEPITSIRATIELETNHIGKGCDRDTYSEKSLHKLCGKSLLLLLFNDVIPCLNALRHLFADVILWV